MKDCSAARAGAPERENTRANAERKVNPEKSVLEGTPKSWGWKGWLLEARERQVHEWANKTEKGRVGDASHTPGQTSVHTRLHAFEMLRKYLSVTECTTAIR